MGIAMSVFALFVVGYTLGAIVGCSALRQRQSAYEQGDAVQSAGLTPSGAFPGDPTTLPALVELDAYGATEWATHNVVALRSVGLRAR